MSLLNKKFRAEPLRSLAFGSIGAAYADIGTPTEFPTRLILMQNFTDVAVIISFYDDIDHFIIPNTGFVLLDCNSNKDNSSNHAVIGLQIEQGTQFRVKQASGAAGSGSVYISVCYGER